MSKLVLHFLKATTFYLPQSYRFIIVKNSLYICLHHSVNFVLKCNVHFTLLHFSLVQCTITNAEPDFNHHTPDFHPYAPDFHPRLLILTPDS